ncbi:hypothetical protein MAUB1S_00959 [Mycolicibacterium aubagnense]
MNVTAVEEDGFWCWAVVETLRHTGIRLEELLELTQLSLRHYTAPTTGTLVPLLHIVPSKTDCERLIPMTPELVQVLVEVLRRAKGGAEHVPLSIRYDTNEKVHGQPFPHLFSRRLGRTARSPLPASHSGPAEPCSSSGPIEGRGTTQYGSPRTISAGCSPPTL